MRMILLRFIAMLKVHWEQMYTHFIEVFFNGNKEEVIWVPLKNIKFVISNCKNKKKYLGYY
jgi:hypothetical protein